MELSKTVAVTAILFMVVLILTSTLSFGAGERTREPAPKPNEASFERSRTNQVSRPAGTEYAPPKKAKAAKAAKRQTATVTKPCQYKAVMTEADKRACKRK